MDGRVEDESQVAEEFEEESQIDGTFLFTDEPCRRAHIRGADLDHPDQLGEAAVIDHEFRAGLLDYEWSIRCATVADDARLTPSYESHGRSRGMIHAHGFLVRKFY